MLKKCLAVIMILISLPSFAGEFQNAIKNNNKVFLYIYTEDCGYCVKFNPIYNNLIKKYASQCKFLKLDANKSEGMMILRDNNIRYVPFVVLIDCKTNTSRQISPSCLLNTACIDYELNKFLKN